MTTMTDETPTHWTLDKRIPVALITGLAIQSAGIVWWARGVVADIDQVRQDKAEIVRRVETIEARTERERIGERIAVLEHQSREQTQLLRDIYQQVTPTPRRSQQP